MEQPTKPIKFSWKAVPAYVLLYANVCVPFFAFLSGLLSLSGGPFVFGTSRASVHAAAMAGYGAIVETLLLVITVLAIRRAKANLSRGFRVLSLTVPAAGLFLCVAVTASEFPLTVLCLGSIACLVLRLAWMLRRARMPVDAPSAGSRPMSDANSREQAQAPAFIRSLFRINALAAAVSVLFAPALCLTATGGHWQESNWLIAPFLVAIGAGYLACFLLPVDLVLCIDSLALRIIVGKRCSPTLRTACWSLAMALLGAAPVIVLLSFAALSAYRAGGFHM